MTTTVNNGWQAWRSWMWPGCCLLCRARLEAGAEWCRGCRAQLPWIAAACPRCAAPLPRETRGAACGRCQRRLPAFDRARAALHYAAPVDRLILDLKYHQRLELARTLGRVLADSLRPLSQPPEVIVPVPLHRSRLRERGYNQSLELARVLAAQLNLPVAADSVRRVRATAAQTGLSLEERARNMRKAFAVDGDLAGQRIAVVDDVTTSGQTVNTLAKALRRAGAKQIEVWVVARA